MLFFVQSFGLWYKYILHSPAVLNPFDLINSLVLQKGPIPCFHSL